MKITTVIPRGTDGPAPVEPPAADGPPAMPPAGSGVRELPIDQIAASTINPRTTFDEAELAELAASIAAHGLIEPLVVRPITAAAHRRDPGDGPSQRWEIVAGERRLRAARAAGLATVLCVLREDLDDRAALELALIENVQRVDLDPIEEAEGYRRLRDLAGLRQSQIAAVAGRSQPAVANRLRLLGLPEAVQHEIRAGALTAAHGVALARWNDYPAVVTALADLAVTEGLTSKAVEDADLLGRYGAAIERSGAVTMLREYGREATIYGGCADACPFAAYRPARWGGGLCLRPEHAAELRAADVAQRDAARAALAVPVAAAGDAATLPLPRMRDLPHDACERLVTPPVDCTPACPCRGQALGYDDLTVVPVCTDPARLRRLRAGQSRADTAARRAAVKADRRRLHQAIDALTEPAARELAVLVAAVWSQVNQPTVIAAVATRHAPALVADRTAWQVRRDLIDVLAGLPPLTVLKLGLEALLESELAARHREAQMHTPRTDWYLGPAPTEEGADVDG